MERDRSLSRHFRYGAFPFALSCVCWTLLILLTNELLMCLHSVLCKHLPTVVVVVLLTLTQVRF